MQSDNSHQKLIEGDGSAHLNQELNRSEKLSGRDPGNKEAQSLLSKDENLPHIENSKEGSSEPLNKPRGQGVEPNKGMRRDSGGEEGNSGEENGKKLNRRWGLDQRKIGKEEQSEGIKEGEEGQLISREIKKNQLSQLSKNKKMDNTMNTNGLVMVKPRPKDVEKPGFMKIFWGQGLRNLMKKGFEDDYVDHAELLPEGIESIEELKRVYEEKRGMKKNKHLSSIAQAHEAGINCLIFTPDERFIISGSSDFSMKVFDAKTKRQIWHFKDAHQDAVKKLVMTYNGEFLISGSKDKSIKVFDFKNKQLVHHFKDVHQGGITALAITPDDNFLVSGSENGEIKIFELKTKQEIYHCQNFHHGCIRSLRVSSDNRFLLSASDDRSIKIFDFHAKRDLHVFKDIHDAVLTLDNNFIISGSADGSIKMFNISTKEQQVGYFNEKVEGEVCELALSFDGQFLFAGLSDGSIVKLNVKTKEKIRHFKDVQPNRICGMAISKRNEFLISCSSTKSIEFTEIDEKQKNYTSIKRAHTDSVTCLTFTPDSRHFISGSDDGSIKIFDFESRKEIRHFKNIHDNKISALKVTPNNKFLISSSWDLSIKIFDFATRELYHQFQNVHAGAIRSIAVTSELIISCSDDKSLKVFDIATKREIYHFKDCHNGPIYGVEITPDNSFIVTCSGDKSIKLFDLNTKQELHKFKDAHNDEILAVSVTPNNKFIVSASRDFSIRIFDIETKNLVHTFERAHNNAILALSISSDSRFVASGSADESVRVFDLETKQMVCHFQNAHNNWVWAVAFAPNKKAIVSGAGDSSIKIFYFEAPMENGEIPKAFQGDPVLTIAISSDNKLIIAGCTGGHLKIFDLKTRDLIHSFISAHNGGIKSITITSDNKFIVSGANDYSIGVFDIKKKKEIRMLKRIHKDGVHAVAITHDSRFIVSGSKDKSIKIIEFSTGEIYHDFQDIHEDTIRSIDVTQDSKFIISGSADKSIKILDIENKRQIYHFEDAHTRWIKGVSVSSDGKLIASCSDDRSIKLFDIKTKQLIHWFKNAHDDFIESVVISKDCKFVISASRDKSIKIFDIKTKQQVHHFQEVHQDRIKSIAFSSDNNFIVSASFDGSIKILKMTPNQNCLALSKNGNELFYVYNGLSKYSNFNAVDDFFFQQKTPPPDTISEAFQRSQQLIIFPYRWNILHILAIRAQHNFIQHMPEYSQFKVPFLLDASSKTPLHYLVAHDKINSNSLNILLTYICDYLDDLDKHQNYQLQEILISLTPLFWLILVKAEIKIREIFLNICFIPTPMPYNSELPVFGKSVAETAYFHPSIEAMHDSIDKTWTTGDQQIDFRTNIVNHDYDVLSKDMGKTIKSLQKQNNEEVFKTDLISTLIHHLWDQSKMSLQIAFTIFSIFIIALSVYLSLEDRYLAYDIVILIGASLFLFAEFLQILNLKLEYIKNPWNWLDSIYFGLTLAFAIDRIVNGYKENLTIAWISTVIIFAGYLRWISYLRIFKPTRNLIQVIVTIMNDMKSFMLIIAMIIVGFSFIFLFFDKGSLYGFYLYNSYGSLYGPVEGEEPDFSQKLIACFIAFLLNVVLLNLLISIMGDSYERVLEKRVKTDSLTRLEMIAEARTLMKYFRFRNKSTEKGYLTFCLSVDGVNEDGEENDWEGKIHVLKRLIKQSESTTEKRMVILESEMNRKYEKVMKEQQEIKEQTTEILKILKGGSVMISK